MAELLETPFILKSVKQFVGISEVSTSFDGPIAMSINTVFGELNDLGIGPKEGFKLKTTEDKWEDFAEDVTVVELVKTYVSISVKLIFSPPESSTVVKQFNDKLSELQWRLMETNKYKNTEENSNE